MTNRAVLGPQGTYSEDAARLLWQHPHELVYASSIAAVFAMVAEGAVETGLVPLANTLAGSISATMNNLARHPVYIVGEITLPVTHCLLAREPLALTEVEVVISQPAAFLQCETFLTERMPWARREIVESTAQAASFLYQERRNIAAIGSRRAGEIYDLLILDERLEDDAGNSTTFIEISRQLGREGDKTSVMFTLKDTPGSLYQALGVFARRGVNLSKLESRPVAGSCHEYTFFADIEGGINHPLIEEALDELLQVAASCRLLGSYDSVERLACREN
jgi:prephenate dehydratase